MSSDLLKLTAGIQMDLRDLQAKVTELRAMIAGLNLPDPSRVTCRCGLTFRGEASYAEHLYVSHGGPEPAHWLEAEAKAAVPLERS